MKVRRLLPISWGIWSRMFKAISTSSIILLKFNPFRMPIGILTILKNCKQRAKIMRIIYTPRKLILKDVVVRMTILKISISIRTRLRRFQGKTWGRRWKRKNCLRCRSSIIRRKRIGFLRLAALRTSLNPRCPRVSSFSSKCTWEVISYGKRPTPSRMLGEITMTHRRLSLNRWANCGRCTTSWERSTNSCCGRRATMTRSIGSRSKKCRANT